MIYAKPGQSYVPILDAIVQEKVTRYRCVNGHEWEMVDPIPHAIAVPDKDTGILNVTVGTGDDMTAHPVCLRCVRDFLDKYRACEVKDGDERREDAERSGAS